jgi:hypothetical protein
MKLQLKIYPCKSADIHAYIGMKASGTRTLKPELFPPLEYDFRSKNVFAINQGGPDKVSGPWAALQLLCNAPSREFLLDALGYHASPASSFRFALVICVCSCGTNHVD